MYSEVYKPFFERRIPKENITFLGEHNVEVRTYDKRNSTLIQFRNVINSTQSFEIDFGRSKNLNMRGGGQIKGNKCEIDIEGQDSVVIELAPRDLREPMILENFDIAKLEKH